VSLDVAKDDSTLIIQSVGFGIRLIDSNTGEVLNKYKDHVNEEYLIRSCFTFDNTHILSGSEDKQLYVYNIVKVSFMGSFGYF
jgi:mitogen-activated protein kinase organizer 1